MKVLRIALMSFGGIELLRLAYIFFTNLNTTSQYKQAKEFVEASSVKVQTSIDKTVEITQSGLNSGAEAVQGGLGAFIHQVNNNGLLIVLVAIVAIYFVRRALRQGSSAAASE
jgi:hypothetical protein